MAKEEKKIDAAPLPAPFVGSGIDPERIARLAELWGVSAQEAERREAARIAAKKQVMAASDVAAGDE